MKEQGHKVKEKGHKVKEEGNTDLIQKEVRKELPYGLILLVKKVNTEKQKCKISYNVFCVLLFNMKRKGLLAQSVQKSGLPDLQF